MSETDAEWAKRQAREITEDADYYDRMIRKYGRNPVWLRARDESLDAAYRLLKLARCADAE